MYIRVLDTTTNKIFELRFNSFYLLNKRLTKLRYSKKLKVLAHTNMGSDY